jgi:cytochrome P450
VANGWLWFASGTETITIALSFAVYELALNPGAQRKLYAEIAAALDTDGRIDYDSIARLPYLEAVFAETLRLHAPLHRIARYANRDYALDNGTGIVIKSGQKVEVPAYAMHHMNEHFADPDGFKPDRFLPENRGTIAPYTYVPFGVGPRYCVAMNFATLEVKLTLATLVTRYEFVRSPNTDVPPLLKDMIEIHSPKRMVLSVIKRP